MAAWVHCRANCKYFLLISLKALHDSDLISSEEWDLAYKLICRDGFAQHKKTATSRPTPWGTSIGSDGDGSDTPVLTYKKDSSMQQKFLHHSVHPVPFCAPSGNTPAQAILGDPTRTCMRA
jgi:hypothetical protein